MPVTVRVIGLKELEKWASEFPKKFKKRNESNLKKVGKLIQRESKKRAPIKTGQLRSDIKYTTHEDGVRVYIEGASEEYAAYMHWGHYKDGKTSALYSDVGRLFITRAMMDNLDKEAQIIGDIGDIL